MSDIKRSEGAGSVDLETPWVVFVLLTVLVAVFLREVSCLGLNDSEPGLSTLIDLGASSRDLILSGQWFRLLTATFLHASLSHLFFNGVALGLGYSLERVIGGAWFLGVYVLSALGGSLASLAFNPAAQVGVGASGAILGVFGAQVVFAYGRYADGETRRYLADRAWRVLLPTLASLTGANGEIDFAAHLGGAVSGAATAFCLLHVWRANETYPHDRAVAWSIGAVAAAVLLYAAAGPLRNACGP